jgi:hypothetical protein
MTNHEWQVLQLLREQASGAIASGDLLARLPFSSTSAYRALRELLKQGYAARELRQAQSTRPNIWHLWWWRTPEGSARLAVTPEPCTPERGRRYGAANRSPRPDDDGLLLESNSLRGAVTFRQVMTERGLSSIEQLRDLPVPERRRFEARWTQLMYDHCAAAGTPINFVRERFAHDGPGLRPSRQPVHDDDDDDDDF